MMPVLVKANGNSRCFFSPAAQQRRYE